MPPVIKQTSRQVKAAYRKSDGRPSDREVRRLENLAAADRRAEELRAKEKQRVINKKKREEKAKKDREARLAIGIGDATQRAGFNFTQHRQKDWFRGYFQKPKQPLANPSLPDSDDENDENKSLTCDEKSHESDTADGSIDPCDTGDDGETSNDTDESLNVNSTHTIQDDSANKTDPQETDDCGDAEVAKATQEAILVETSTPGTASDDGTDPSHISIGASALDADDQIPDADAFVTEIGEEDPIAGEAMLDISEGVPHAADGDNLVEQDDFDDTDFDDDTMLELAQFELPTVEALFPRSEDLNGNLPAMKTASQTDTTKPNTQAVQETATPDRHPHAMSDFFSSSELDISAEDMAEIDAPLKLSPLWRAKPVPRAPSTPSRTIAPKQPRLHASPTPLATKLHSNPTRTVSGNPMMPPPPKPTHKRKFNTSTTTTLPSPKRRKSPTAERHPTTTATAPKPTTPLKRPPGRLTPASPFRFASIGMSTQFIADSLSDDDDALLLSPAPEHRPNNNTISPPPPSETLAPLSSNRRVPTSPCRLAQQRSSHFADYGLSTQLVCEAAWEDVVLSSQ